MLSPTSLLLAWTAATTVSATTSPFQTSTYPSGPCPWTPNLRLTHEQVLTNYLSLWAGNYTLLNDTVTPTFQLWQDRFPTGSNASVSLPITSSQAMQEFIQTARSKFTSYNFIRQLSMGVDNMVVLRWTLNATWGGDEHSSVPKGTHIAYNGTDWALLDPCTGKMEQVLSAQDSITYAHVTGQYIGAV